MKLTLLVGPPGSGKSTLARQLESDTCVRISQDDQGKSGHKFRFNYALENKLDIVVDRMNFSCMQRSSYLAPAKAAGYETEIIVLHESLDTCFNRCSARQNHPTIKDNDSARSALNTFFSKYERVQDNEADKVTRFWPDCYKPRVAIVDLDGTLCNIDHRLHHMKDVIVDDKVVQKKSWPKFFADMDKDTPNEWCEYIISGLDNGMEIIFCSGRPDNYRAATQEWLTRYGYEYNKLFMRNRNDSRKDSIAKEIILDFEILTRWTPFIAIDDRKQVVDMWRSRGIVCLQCAPGEF